MPSTKIHEGSSGKKVTFSLSTHLEFLKTLSKLKSVSGKPGTILVLRVSGFKLVDLVENT